MSRRYRPFIFFFFQAEDGIRYLTVTGVQTCALPISLPARAARIPRTSFRPDPAEWAASPPAPSPGPCQSPRSPESFPPDSAPARAGNAPLRASARSEEHTSELQSQSNLVCRLLLEKNNAH